MAELVATPSPRLAKTAAVPVLPQAAIILRGQERWVYVVDAAGLAQLRHGQTGAADSDLLGSGVAVRFDTPVTAIDGAEPAVVHTAFGPVRARTVIVCAGLWADRHPFRRWPSGDDGAGTDP